MSSAALLPTVAAGVLSVTTPAAFLGWPSSGAAQLQIRMSPPVALGYRGARYGAGALIKRCTASSVLHRDDVQAGSSSGEEQEVKILSSVEKMISGSEKEVGNVSGMESTIQNVDKEVKILSSVEEMIAGFEKEVGNVSGMESTIQNVDKVGAGLPKEVVRSVNRAGGMETKTRQKMSHRKNERTIYLLAAIASTTGFTALSAAACVYRFYMQMPESGSIPYGEVFGTFSLAVGAAVGMEYWARWAHKALWHASLWHMHESHHKPRDGPFETNDVFAIINAVPAIALMLYGFLNSGIVPAVCFGAGLGITMFGIAYMFVHDGLVHRRFPVGPIAEVPYFQKVAAAHQLHHADLYEGVPYGLFLGPKELEDVGGGAELEKWLSRYRARAAAGASAGKEK